MSVLSLNDGLLTNVEVLELLRSAANPPADPGKRHPSASLEPKLVAYLESVGKGVDMQAAREMLRRLRALGLDLTEAELTMLVNHAPASQVEVYLIVESCGERLSDEAVESIRLVTSSYLPPDPNE